MADLDGFESYYANRLWQLLPAVYRARDSADAGVSGPLQELVWRIGAQIAAVRRSIDRLWADQSIETCDDWVIPYIGDLLGTNLASGLGPRGQRLDVAKTIHYRRRKGTIAVLEEVGRDITGWEAHVVEAFRRLGRTRHGLDPPLGGGALSVAAASGATSPVVPAATVAELLRHEGLVGPLTATSAGGLADLRSPHGAALAGSPFDEFTHTADLRRGEGAYGRYGLVKLLVFLWRLQAFTVVGGSPVRALDTTQTPAAACPNADTYVFDPTGRRIPLFLPPLAPEPDDWADNWTPAPEWNVPGPLTGPLLRALGDPGGGPPPHASYPEPPPLSDLFAAAAGEPAEPVAIAACWPEAGQFQLSATPDQPLTVTYHYGFASMIGAGPYDRTLLGDPPVPPADELPVVSGGAGLDTAIPATAPSGTLTIADSLTYVAVGPVGSTAAPVRSLLLRAGPELRPVVRLPAPSAAGDPPAAWVFTGGGAGSELTLDGLLVSGGDIVLRGGFSSVRFTACTTDPGSLDPDGALATAADGRSLAPVRIWIEADPGAPAGAPGAITKLTIDHCVLGPVRTRDGGAVESVVISDSIIQGITPTSGPALSASDLQDTQLLAQGLTAEDPVSQRIFGMLPAPAQAALTPRPRGRLSGATLAAVLDGLNAVISGPTSVDSPAFDAVALPPAVARLHAEARPDLAALNRGLVEAVFPVALGPAALACNGATVTLDRVTVMGAAFAHRLSASDTILSDFIVVDDTQHGCVRFSAIGAGSASRVPRQYRSVRIEPGGALFTSTAFGHPGYGQLLETADRAIDPTSIAASAPAPATITAGADSGSEMGAYSAELAPIKERGLLSKYAEYMPLGLTPVVIHVT